MGWNDKFSQALGWGVDATLNVTGSVFSVGGRILSAAGGIGVVVGEELNKAFNLVYYADVVAAGGLSVNGQISGSQVSFNYTLPLKVRGERDGHVHSELTSYLNPQLFYIVGAACIGSGMLLTTLGDSIKKWQEYRYDARYAQEHFGLDLPRPSGKEMLVSMGQSCCSSLTISMLSHSMISCIAQYSHLFDANLTYPFTSDMHANGTYYKGPLANGSYPIAVSFDPQTLLMDVPYIGKVNMTLDMALQGIAHVNYGGGAFLTESGTPNAVVVTPAVTEAVSATLGTSSYFALKFFERTAKIMRDNRIEATRISNLSIQDESMGLLNNT
jgi:hypothetical protein